MSQMTAESEGYGKEQITEGVASCARALADRLWAITRTQKPHTVTLEHTCLFLHDAELVVTVGIRAATAEQLMLRDFLRQLQLEPTDTASPSETNGGSPTLKESS